MNQVFDISTAWFLTRHAVSSVNQLRYKKDEKAILCLEVTEQKFRPSPIDTAFKQLLTTGTQEYFCMWINPKSNNPHEKRVSYIHELIHIYLGLTTGCLWGNSQRRSLVEEEIDELSYGFVKGWGEGTLESMLVTANLPHPKRRKVFSVAELRNHYLLHPQQLAFSTRSFYIRKRDRLPAA